MTEAEIAEMGQWMDAHQTPEDQRPLGLGSSLLFSGEGVRRLMAADQRRREQAQRGGRSPSTGSRPGPVRAPAPSDDDDPGLEAAPGLARVAP